MFNSVEHLTQPCEMKDIKSAYCMMIGRLNVCSSLLLLITYSRRVVCVWFADVISSGEVGESV